MPAKAVLLEPSLPLALCRRPYQLQQRVAAVSFLVSWQLMASDAAERTAK
jgi:hypothetical protein